MAEGERTGGRNGGKNENVKVVGGKGDEVEDNDNSVRMVIIIKNRQFSN